MNFKRLCSKIFVAVFVTTAILSGSTSQAKCAEITEGNLKSKVVPLKTVQARNGLDDFNSLQTILKDKKIVAVGEATHGTKEFFQMKHRMFEFLVEKMGFRLFGIEAAFGECRAINDYILYGKGKAEDVVSGMGFWTWSTKEVVDMVQWMRAYNGDPNHKTKIKFYGFDMQSANKDKEIVLNYIKKVDSKSLKNYNDALSKFNVNELTAIKNKVGALSIAFEKNKNQYISKSSKSEYEITQQHLNIIIQCLDLTIKNKGFMANASEVRDYYMAQNVKWILNYEKQFGNDKIMLWAHNGHVAKKFPGYVSMGQNLKGIFKDDVYVIGQEFYKGSFRAISHSIFPTSDSNRSRLREFNIEDSYSNTFAYRLEKANVPLYFIDFKEASKDKDIDKWLSENQLVHEIGAVYSQIFQSMSLCPQVPKEAFDGIIFIRETSASIDIK
ncbi:erythromycin esterase [Clostridium tetanomorphum]|uniref:Erythromycin esterase family protein n=1 Tax=Clostridium tetanomorphum TaxID=1553 RepID=A0A923E8V1_CLOTT|nr:erythromycin esterase family protein [Clostridium tetanomorphum]KAJ53707.1 erythromycin esterase [Clostridium tetanomorphum DSM 665]MBC2397219.1 erythromycin esterase family protein [Clostridium tetanomorphum]MBP1862435.1 erythromycin esterase [Clostridium tetanomorphum]NRS85725.1 erythromycin esterase [Clostridium tetanomorphum]NRZ96266.1 erythromycin esterase [Clostridium tetanomorphum]